MSERDIHANNRVFEKAVADGDVGQIAALLAPDVISLPPDAPTMFGKPAVTGLWAAAIKEHGLTGFAITTDTLDFAGDTAVEVGHAILSMTPLGAARQTAKVKFVVVWKRLNGAWLMHRDIWNADVS
jgi:ketosteroid isomerase-like protein